MTPKNVFQALSEIAQGRVLANMPLKNYGTWRIGGPADWMIFPNSIKEIAAIQKFIFLTGLPSIVIGGGSNILFDDAGFRGVVIHVGKGLSALDISSSGLVRAEAGIWTPLYVRRVTCAGFAGCSHAIGIPGTLGGLIAMNGGTSRKGIGDHLLDIAVVDARGEVKVLSRNECGFGYRTSRLLESKNIIAEARFQYEKDDASKLRREMIKTLKDRNRKFPRKQPNCGSVFLSDPHLHETIGSPGKIIENAGLKGHICGGAQISKLHANFIINTGAATSDDVLNLIAQVRKAAHGHSRHWLGCEVRHLLPDGQILPAHVSAERL